MPPFDVVYHLAPLQACDEADAAALSCDAVCASKGFFCFDGMQEALTTADKVRAAFASAGRTCTHMQTKCEPPASQVDTRAARPLTLTPLLALTLTLTLMARSTLTARTYSPGEYAYSYREP